MSTYTILCWDLNIRFRKSYWTIYGTCVALSLDIFSIFVFQISKREIIQNTNKMCITFDSSYVILKIILIEHVILLRSFILENSDLMVHAHWNSVCHLVIQFLLACIQLGYCLLHIEIILDIFVSHIKVSQRHIFVVIFMSFVPYSRIYLIYHTFKQVIYGWIIGTLFAIGAFFIVS